MFAFMFVVALVSPSLIQGAPLPVQLVDLTHVFDNNTLHWPTQKKFEIHVTYNGTYNNTMWLQIEEYSTGTHVGTHMDAPCHFVRGAWTMDDIPVERFVAPAAVVDITEKAEANRDYEVTVEDLTQWESQTGHTLDETVVLIRSGWSKRWGNRTAFTGTPRIGEGAVRYLHFPGMSVEAAQWLVNNRKIYGLGTETLSLDPGPSQDFRVHQILLGANIYGLENVANMDDLPIYGATLYALPMKIGSGSGAPTRIVASYPKMTFGRRHSGGDRALREVIIFS